MSFVLKPLTLVFFHVDYLDSPAKPFILLPEIYFYKKILPKALIETASRFVLILSVALTQILEFLPFVNVFVPVCHYALVHFIFIELADETLKFGIEISHLASALSKIVYEMTSVFVPVAIYESPLSVHHIILPKYQNRTICHCKLRNLCKQWCRIRILSHFYILLHTFPPNFS